MRYRLGDVVRVGLVGAVPAAAGACATAGEACWGAALFLALTLIPRLAAYAGPLAVAYGLLVGARLLTRVPAGGPTAVVIGCAFIAAAAFVLSLLRRRPGVAAWAAGMVALATVAAAGVAATVIRPATFNLALTPLAALTALWALATPEAGRAADGRARLPVVALGLGLGVAGIRLAAAFALVPPAEGALAAGDARAAYERASWARALGAGARGELTQVNAAGALGGGWPELERLAEAKAVGASPRPFDAALALIAFRRADYERAAMYGDLATTPTRTAPAAGKPMRRDDVYRSFAAATPYARAWAAAWGGRSDEAARLFGAGPATPAWRRATAMALERAGDKGAAAAIYEALWRADPGDLAAGLGWLRAGEVVGARGEVWHAMGRLYPKVLRGARLTTPDGLVISKGRLSLGRTAATAKVWGPGRKRLALIAEGTAFGGLYPIVAVTVNGAPVRTFYMDAPGEAFYGTTITLRPGWNVVGVRYGNDDADPRGGGDRNVYLRELRVGDD